MEETTNEEEKRPDNNVGSIGREVFFITDCFFHISFLLFQ
jgi:hypothetical protein